MNPLTHNPTFWKCLSHQIGLAILMILFSTNLFGQLKGAVGSFHTSDDPNHPIAAEFICADLGEEIGENRELDRKEILIPKKVSGKKVIPDPARFRVELGRTYRIDENIFAEFWVYFDSETPDPRDDVYISSVSCDLGSGDLSGQTLSFLTQEPAVVFTKIK